MKRITRRILSDTQVQSPENSGTTYYRTKLDDVIDQLSKHTDNIILVHQLSTYGWEALDFKNHLFGSDVYDNDLYICVTDGEDIMVDGAAYDPEYAMLELGADALSEYVKDADPTIISRYITEYEFLLPDLDEVAIELLDSGERFIDIVKSARSVYPDISDEL